MKELNLLRELLKEEIPHFKSDLQDKYNQIKSELHTRFEDGYATCTLGTYAICMLRDTYEMQVADGEFNGQGHWFVVVTLDGDKYIADIGNNLTREALKTGVIIPTLVKYPNKTYTIDSLIDPDIFVDQIYPKIKNY